MGGSVCSSGPNFAPSSLGSSGLGYTKLSYFYGRGAVVRSDYGNSGLGASSGFTTVGLGLSRLLLRGTDVISLTPSLLLIENFSPKSIKFDVAVNPDSLGSLSLDSVNFNGSSYRLGLAFTMLLHKGLVFGMFLEKNGGCSMETFSSNAYLLIG